MAVFVIVAINLLLIFLHDIFGKMPCRCIYVVLIGSDSGITFMAMVIASFMVVPISWVAIGWYLD